MLFHSGKAKPQPGRGKTSCCTVFHLRLNVPLVFGCARRDCAVRRLAGFRGV